MSTAGRMLSPDAYEVDGQAPTVVVVATRYGKTIEPDWKVWPGRDFDDVIAEVATRVKENHRSMEVREVRVLRHVAVNPIVETVAITEPAVVVEGTDS